MIYRIDGESEWALEFGKKLKHMIDVKKISQAYIAKALGVSRQIFSKYVHGKALPSVYKAQKIANILGCELDDLL